MAAMPEPVVWTFFYYLAPEMAPGPADPAYVERIVAPAKEMGFPDWYVRRLESYRR